MYAICQSLSRDLKLCKELDVILPVEPPNVNSNVLYYCYIAIIALLVTAVVCVMIQRWKYSRIMDLEVMKKIDRYYQLKENDSLKSQNLDNAK
jgi:hypothetical protein